MTNGCERDGFMTIVLTFINEIPGIKNEYSGMVIGFMMFFMGLGNLIAPSLGNGLANGTMAGAPLIFWAATILFGGLCVFFVSRWRHAITDLKSTDIEGI